ncbi:MAG: hypothetical protein HOV68_15140 [Streptomycetaceae bacterium]|nr:hypothetical protein [Streptomycetaceae bacterium]
MSDNPTEELLMPFIDAARGAANTTRARVGNSRRATFRKPGQQGAGANAQQQPQTTNNISTYNINNISVGMSTVNAVNVNVVYFGMQAGQAAGAGAQRGQGVNLQKNLGPRQQPGVARGLQGPAAGPARP